MWEPINFNTSDSYKNIFDIYDSRQVYFDASDSCENNFSTTTSCQSSHFTARIEVEWQFCRGCVECSSEKNH